MPNFPDGVKTPERTAFERQFNANSDAHDLIGQLCRFANLLCGPMPTAATPGAAGPAYDGFVGDVSREADRLFDRVAEGRDALRRIERAFPDLGQQGVETPVVFASAAGSIHYAR